MDPEDPLIGKELNRCMVQRKLGQGGMGAVYLAHHPGLNRSVAIKVLPGDLASKPEFKERFFREARLAARLEHPNVVQVHDVGEEQGTRYLVMQHLQGEALATILESGPLPIDRAVQYAAAIAGALDAGHRRRGAS